jgi:hypothetical protein
MKRMAMVLAAMAVLMVGTVVKAGAFGGGQLAVGETVGAREYAYTDVDFRGGEYAEVAVVGNGYTDLDLVVLDEYGNAVAVDNFAGDKAFVRFYVAYDATYTIVVYNHGNVTNVFDFATN